MSSLSVMELIKIFHDGHDDVTATVSTVVGNVKVQCGQNCLQVICEAGPAIKQVVSRVMELIQLASY